MAGREWVRSVWLLESRIGLQGLRDRALHVFNSFGGGFVQERVRSPLDSSRSRVGVAQRSVGGRASGPATLSATMKSPPPTRPHPRALLIALLALVAVATAVLQSCDPSNPALPTSGAPETLDPSAWPAIETERVASTELTFNPRGAADPGTNFVISADGELFVAQWQDQTIQVIGEAGEVIRTIGRSGEGPGEFISLSAIWLAGDTLVATDRQLMRVNSFATDGRFLDSRKWVSDFERWSVDEAGTLVIYTPGSPPSTILANGLALVSPNSMVRPPQDPPDPGPRRGGFRSPLLTMDEHGQIVDTLAWDEFPWMEFNMARDGRHFRIQVPFQREIHTAVMPGGGGVIVVREDDSAGPSVLVTRIGPSADAVFSRTYSYTPALLTDDLFRRALNETEVGEMFRMPGGERDDAPESAEFEGPVRRSGVLPEILPTVTSVVVGQDESIWVRREEQEGEFAQWTVLDGTGEVLGVVTLPRRQEVVAARGAVMVVVEEDELGRASLVRYRVAYDQR